MPNDDAEQDRLDLTHHICRLLRDGGLYIAPLTDPKRCLDLGTGTGIWAIDFADEFPKYASNRQAELEANLRASAKIIGTDLSPIQPSWIPTNLRFLVDDMVTLISRIIYLRQMLTLTPICFRRKVHGATGESHERSMRCI